MKFSNSYLMLLIVAGVLFSVGFACNNGGSSTPNTSSGNTGTAPSPAPTSSAPKNIAGDYDADGTNPDGKGTYKASLKVTPHDDVYQFSWNSAGNVYDGVGVMTDNQVAVSYADGGSGEGCGVVLYKMGANNTLEGKVGYWGSNTMETETATRTDGSAKVIDGVYAVNGKNPNGEPYKAELTVAKSGEGYTFDWTGASTFSGFGISGGDYIAVGFGGKQCSFVGYSVKADGTLDGQWGNQVTRKFGTEIAKKK